MKPPGFSFTLPPGSKVLGVDLAMVEAAPSRWEVAIPIHFTSLNKLMRMHWAPRKERLAREAMVIGVCCRLAGVPKATGKRRVTQRITLVGRDRKKDPDNINKSVNDALVKAGILVDDSAEWVEIGHPKFERGTERMTTIIIEDID